MPILSPDRVNAGRQKELDIARGLAVLFMVLVHVQEYFSSAQAKATHLGEFVGFVGGIPAAPVFLFLLGIGIVFSRKDDWQSMVRRGCLLVLAGYALNLGRGTLPFLVRWAPGGTPGNVLLAVRHFAGIDIFQAAGVSMILFGFLKRAGWGNGAVFGLTLLLVGTLPAGTRVKFYEDDESLTDAVIVGKKGDGYVVNTGSETETLPIAELLLSGHPLRKVAELNTPGK
jgi:uncharacterized membrane protein